MRLGRLARTVRHLRPVQVYGRLWFLLHRPSPVLAPAPALRAVRGAFVLPARRAQSLFPGGRWRFLNQEATLAQVGWDDASLEKLWRYNLHYFDDLNAHGAADRIDAQRAMIDAWIRDNAPGRGTGWEPYPTSLRIVNWVKWMLAGGPADSRMRDSLAVQARWLRAKLEHHLQGNHLFANYKALAFAGAFFDGEEAARWLAFALRGLRREVDEQILDDGGQFERSPMYHALALEDVLDLANLLAGVAPPSALAAELAAELHRRLPAMLHWLRAMSHPDGALSHFNDSAPGVAPDNAELERFARALGVRAAGVDGDGVTHLPDSGYVRVSRGAAVALLDVAPIGPDYLPGHAHADSLSMELSIAGRRVVVNGGTSCYGVGARRLHERSTVAHSTVEVAGQSSSEVWGGFRVGRRARICDLAVGGDAIAASHDGYCFLKGAPRHRRQWTFADRGMDVLDRVEPGAHPAVARFHLAPGLTLRETAPGRFDVRDGETHLASVAVEQGSATARETLRATAFGVLVPAPTLEVALAGGVAHTRWNW